MSATGFLDACGFNPASGGTGDFVVSAAVTGYQTPAGAGAVNGAVYSYRAQSSDLSQWEIGYGAYATGTTTLARTTVTASSTGSKVNFSAPPSVYVTALTADLDDPWRQQPVGVPIPILDSITGVAQPPTGNPYRYIKLTASDSYNTGVLTSESVTGSAPLVVATAVISLSGSPINGQTVNLINTEGRFLRGSTSAGTVQNDQMQTITGNVDGQISLGTKDGAFTTGASLGVYGAPGANYGFSKASFNSSNSSGARTGTETRSKNIGVTFFMRVK